MKHVPTLLKHHWQILLLLCFGLFLGLFQLNNLPAEMWGDATAHYGLVQQVMHGQLFYNYRYGGDGPIYTYCAVFVSWLFGLSFYTLKLTSVFIYLLFIWIMYVLSFELFKKKEMAIVTAFLATVSFWSITFARQPHARMLVPLFIALTVYFAVKKKTLLSGIFLGLGMYSQASFWAMPLMFWKRYKIFLIGIVITIPLVISFITGGVGFFSNQSYFGEKLATSDKLPLSQVITNIEHNISANFLALYTYGDTGFRLNVPASPHLDTASAIFFSLGFLLLFYKAIKEKQMKYLEFIILPFFIIQIPSLLDIHNPQAQPNIGRMIGIIPFVYMSTAYGLTQTIKYILNQGLKDKKVIKVCYVICIGYLLLVITAANVYKYFIVYPHYLPNQNTPFDRVISQTINNNSVKTQTVIIGSGWGEWGQPEQQAIIDEVTPSHRITFIQVNPPTNELCPMMNKKTVFILSPTDNGDAETIATCKKKTTSYILQQNSFQVARVIEMQNMN